MLSVEGPRGLDPFFSRIRELIVFLSASCLLYTKTAVEMIREVQGIVSRLLGLARENRRTCGSNAADPRALLRDPTDHRAPDALKKKNKSTKLWRPHRLFLGRG